jgi:hypothetical protein
MARSTISMSKIILDISPIWIPLIIIEVTNSQTKCDRFFVGVCKVLVPKFSFYSTDGTIGRNKMVLKNSTFKPMRWFSYT